MNATTMKVDGSLAPSSLPDEAAVEAWFRALLDAGINFHPEESFGEMVYVGTGAACFSAEDAERLDRLMAMAYEVCDPCEVGVRLFEAREGVQSDEG